MNTEQVFNALAFVVVASPAVLVLVLSVPALFSQQLSERAINRWMLTTTTGLLAALAVLVEMLAVGTRHVPIEIGNWVVLPEQHFRFHLEFVFDRLSVPFVILSFLLCGTVSAFASRYLHREIGFGRFYVCYSLFLLGMIVSSLAGTIEVLFFGWEFVGLSSALLVAFFHERPTPPRNGIRVWSVYRLADAAFLIAAVALHHLSGTGDFDQLIGSGSSWPYGTTLLTSWQALVVGLLLLVAAAGKSALVPFSGWLPRAMEGPTPSSAVFYGALSVHLGAFLLLRISPLLDASIKLSIAVTAIGLITAIYASLVARVQTDIKSALAFASLTQVAIIVAEIGVGLRYVALIHIIGHACLRTLQLLRAPTLLHDYHALENAIGESDEPHAHVPPRQLAENRELWWYRFALERGHLDGLIDELIVKPFEEFFRSCDALERRWTKWLSYGESRESDEVAVRHEIVEELTELPLELVTARIERHG